MRYATVERELRRQHFAVLSTADPGGRPASAGVTYALASSGSVLYVMTRRHLQKARNISANPEVALVVPVPRRFLWPAPPASIQLRGRATILDWTDAGGREVFSDFWLGRQILDSYQRLHDGGEGRICFLRIDLDPVIHSYLVGISLWRARSEMRAGSATVVRR